MASMSMPAESRASCSKSAIASGVDSSLAASSGDSECHARSMMDAATYSAVAKPWPNWEALETASSSSSGMRSEEHTSELQSRGHLVCRLLLEKKKRYKD